MDLAEIFDAIGRQMLIDFEHIHRQIKHLGERGSEREAGLISFLEAYLPSKFAISTGEIVDTVGNTSHQCDLIIYDKLNCPLLLVGKGYRVFPAESVYAVVEVKSVLSGTELKDAVEKISCVKNLKRENGPIAGIIFAYKANRKRDVIGKTVEELEKLDIHYAYLADIICILSSGIIALISNEDGITRIPKNPLNRVMMCYHELDVPVLLIFFSNLLDLLEGQSMITPTFLQYLRPGSIGSVSVRDLRTEKKIIG